MIQILAELPGFTTADLKIEVRGTRVVISGTKSTALPEAQTSSLPLSGARAWTVHP